MYVSYFQSTPHPVTAAKRVSYQTGISYKKCSNPGGECCWVGHRSKSYNKSYQPRSTNGRVLSLTEFQARMLAAIAAAWGSRGGGEGWSV